MKEYYYGFLINLVYWLHCGWTAVQHLIWRFDGTAERISRILADDESDQPAQVLKIVWTNPFIFLITQWTFFTRHERFAPASIIDNKRVHLLSVNSRTATFTEVDQDILDTRKFPFMFRSQAQHATKLIVLPVRLFYKLVDKMDVSDRRMVWLFHTLRCGSTAWVQAFNSIPNTTVYSEPIAMYYSVAYGDHGYSSAESFSKSKEYKRIAVAVVKTLLHNTPRSSLVVWKTTAFDLYLIDVIAECFPQHKMLATYRDSLPSVTSCYKSFCHLPTFRYRMEMELNHDPYDDKWWFCIPNIGAAMNGADHNFCRKIRTEVRPRTGPEWFCFLWAAMASATKGAVERGRNVKCIKYDSLLENKRLTVSKVLEYLDLSEHTDVALETFNIDSQAGMEKVSWKTRGKGDGLEWCQEGGVVKRCNMILEAFGLPDINSSFDLPGTF